MTLGQRIKKLRNEKGLTQKDLADQVHVTFQTISKWEKDENEPDVTTLRELAKLFGCSMDYLLNEEESHSLYKASVEEKPAPAPVEQVVKTVIIHQNEAHVCARCGKDIPEDDLVSEDVTRKERHGPHTRSVSIGQTYYHKECLNQVKAEREKEARRIRTAKTSRSKKLSWGWGIAGGIAALVIALLIFLMLPACKESIHPALGVLYSILIGYGIFAMIYCILSGSYIGEVFVEMSSWSIKMPGVIFSWDIDGVVWAIAMKITLTILGLILGALVIGLAITISALLASVSFPFVLIHNERTGYADAL